MKNKEDKTRQEKDGIDISYKEKKQRRQIEKKVEENFKK